ncbi:MAG: M13 family metallopeptidase [Armatimonadetes bacterium]|nr:M13 family metallopeptidase [Armatimonadota bacterium]
MRVTSLATAFPAAAAPRQACHGKASHRQDAPALLDRVEVGPATPASGGESLRAAPAPTLSPPPQAQAPNFGWNLAGAPATAVAPVGFDPANLDPTTRPQDDFFQFAMGGYLAARPIPPDRDRFGIDTEITMRNEQTVKEILDELAAGSHRPGSLEQKLGDLYASGMDLRSIEAAGLSPLRGMLDRIDSIASQADLQRTIAELHNQGVSVYFGFGASQDAANPEQMIGELWQGGLGLPDRDYYLPQDEDSRKTLSAYQAHVARTFQLMGQTSEEAARSAETVLRMEAALARASLSAAERRDPEALQNHKDLAGLEELTPGFSWPEYFELRGAPPQQEVNVATPRFFEELDRVLTGTTLEDHKTYLRWQLVSGYANYLSSAFENESFDFYGRTLKGTTEMPPRHKRVAAVTDQLLGEALGQKFVERRFSPEAKARVLEMVDNFKAVLRDNIEGVPWMGEETRQAALEKLSSFTAKIGYPEHPESYSGLDIGPDGYARNAMKATAFAVRKNLDQIGKPVDRGRWLMTAATNNAYYEPLMNEIAFPAAILQSPYFDLNFDDAMNYGAIGATIGHEMGHGFDDEGAQFDARGNLRNWFSPEDQALFQQMAKGVERQYGEYVVEGLPVNGKLVLGEALADLGGLEVAYSAFQKAMQGKPREVVDGFTPEQRFFLSFAQSWATNMRPELSRYIVRSDPHPHPKLRVNGTVSNMPEFFEAFSVRPGEPMRRPEEKRNHVWS